MANSRKFNTYLGLVLMLSMVSFVPTPSWANCKNSGGSASGHKVSSQVRGGSVTVCASAVSVSPARKVVVKKPAKKSKAVTKPLLSSLAKPVSRPLFNPAVKVIPKKVVLKAKPKKKTVTKAKTKKKTVTKLGSSNSVKGSLDFQPASVTGSVYPSSQLKVGQRATFVTSAFVHYRSGKLLSLPTEVRFTPISVSWGFGGGSGGSGASLEHAFDSAGIKGVLLRVAYRVAYRVKGSSGWISEPDTISVSDDLVVHVSEGAEGVVPPDPASFSGRVLLVGADCLARPGAFGCN